MHIAVIINQERQDAPEFDKEQLDAAASKYDLTYDLFLIKPQDIQETIQKVLSESYNGFLIGGGDGTVRSAVQLLLQQDAPIAILPLGTFNYFAKELDFPNDIDSMFKLIKNNKVKLVDVGEVNNQIFLNHSSIGFYTRIMKMRQRHPLLLSRNKLLKILFTTFSLFKTLSLYNITLEIEGEKISKRISLLVVGNNDHSTDMINSGNPIRLSLGRLEILAITCQTKWQMFKCMLAMLFKENSKFISKCTSDSLTVSADLKLIDVVLDGDLFKLDVPLNYTINHKQLSVYIP